MLSKLTIIPRSEIQAVTEVMEGGEMHFLGQQRDFRRHPVLAEFLTEETRLAMAWVRLRAGEVLAPHRHPVRSMILVCRGRGQVLGEVEGELTEGDAVLVPSGHVHGFRGLEPDGVEGLSIQFEDRGLYEDMNNPLVKFEPT